ncbi:MAG: SUMF1/EgtB/PvdO family nonheme iron enzyme [Gammaproteobacteria bacterium]|nr:SUMF1/EgtB/PvdO family nonheme iron enzyme [Gammaproteobacteria bacterium]
MKNSFLLFTVLFLGGCATSPEPDLIPFVKITAGQLDYACPPIAVPCGTTIEKKFQATISEFEIAQHETTVAMFRKFIAETGYVTLAERASEGQKACRPYDGVWVNSKSWQNPGFLQTDYEPVVCLALVDIQAYIEWLNNKGAGKYRLPTADEWRYASLLANPKIYSEESDVNVDNPKHTRPVSSQQSDVSGLNGMQSNVSEFTSSCADDSCDEVFALGASFFHDNPYICEDYSLPANKRLPFIGFRLVKIK